MAKNEISQLNDYLVVDFSPASIDFLYKNEIQDFTSKLAEKYADLVYTADDLKELREDKSQLLSVYNQLEERRKEIKREYNKPLTTYEKEVKEVQAPLNKVLDDIRETEKRIEEKQKELRADILQDYISKQTDLDIELEPSWLNKGAFTAKDGLKAKTKEQITEAIKAKEAELEQQEADRQAVIKYAEAKGLETGGYVDLLAYQPLAEIMAKIDQQVAITEPDQAEKLAEPEPQQEDNEPTENPLPWVESKNSVTIQVMISGEKDKVMKIVDLAIKAGLTVDKAPSFESAPTLEFADSPTLNFATDYLPW